MTKPRILYITDLYYKAANRLYYTEDIFITGELKNDFDLLICHPLHSSQFEDKVDLIVIRNSGPVIYYKSYFNAFVKRVSDGSIKTYNSFDGKGDQRGKNYLLELTTAGFKVIPTIDSLDNVGLLPSVEKFVVKPKEGADSIGMKIKTAEELQKAELKDEIVQPYINFIYEVSFYFLDNVFQYALYAPDKSQRWKLEKYTPTHSDLAFANNFVEWNNMAHGIQRIDACRTASGELLLVEIEDLNPYLSLDLLDEKTRELFINNFKKSLQQVVINS